MPPSRRWPSWALRLFLASLASCGPAPAPIAPAPPAAPVVVVPPPATAEPVATSEPAPAALAEIELPARSACVLEGGWFSRQGWAKLYFREGGPAFALIYSGRGKLRFPLGPRPAVQGLELEADGIAVVGYVDADATDLRATKPFLLSSLALPTTYTRFHWTEAAEGELTVTTDAPAALELLGGPLTAKRPCSEITLDRLSFSAESAIDGFAKAKQKQLVPGRAIDLALGPGDKPVARAKTDDVPLSVSVLETRGKHARIAWSVGPLLVVAWVAASDLRATKSINTFGMGSGRVGNHYTDHGKKVRCQEDVRLIVEAGDERAVAGWIRAGTTIEITAITGDTSRIMVRSSSIQPGDRAAWYATNADLDRCQEQR